MEQNEKCCTKCRRKKFLVEFSINRRNRDGRSRQCKLCLNTRRKTYTVNLEKKQVSQAAYNQSLKGKIQHWKHSAKVRNIQWHLTLADLEKLPLKCFYTSLDLTFQSNQHHTVSLDRIDSNKDYTIDNIVFCCEVVNKMKQDLSVDEFVRFCRMVVYGCSEC